MASVHCSTQDCRDRLLGQTVGQFSTCIV
jgi:hypothetical protein